MLTASTSYAVKVAGRAMTLKQQLQVTLQSGTVDLSAKLVSAEPDESITTDMPSGTNTAVGYPSRGFDFTITDTAGLFDPANTSSPLYGAEMHYLPVVFKEGLYTGTAGELLTKFTGSTVSWKRSSASKTVTFSCVDGRSRLKSVTSLPAVLTIPPYSAGLTAEAAVDALLRAASGGAISSWPKQRSKCLFAAGFRASPVPEVGSLDVNTLRNAPFTTGYQTTPSYLPCGNGSGFYGATMQQAYIDYLPCILAQPTTSSTLRYEFDIYVDQSVTSLTDPYEPDIVIASLSLSQPSAASPQTITIDVLNSGHTVQVWLYSPTQQPNRPGDNTGKVGPALTPNLKHHVVVLLSLPAAGGTTMNITVQVDGVTTGPTAVAIPAYMVQARQNLAIDAQLSIIAAVQVTTESTIGPSNYGFVPQAVLDPSLNTLQVFPAVDGDPWQTIQQIADAEQAVAGFDEAGIFRFVNRNTLRSTPSVRTVTGANMLPLDPESDSTAKATRVQVGYTRWVFSAPKTVWTAQTPLSFPARKISTQYVSLSDTLVASVDTTGSLLPFNSAGNDGNTYYRASVDTAGTSSAQNFTVTVALVSPTRLAITVDARKTQTKVVFVASADNTDIAVGTPTFQVGGITATAATETVADAQWPPLEADGSGGAASNPAGEILVQVTGNPWIQDAQSAQNLANDLLSQLHRAPIMIRNVQVVPPDVRLQLGDRITLVDPVSGLNEPVTIWGQQRELSGFGSSLTYTHTLDVRMVATRVGGWILGQVGRGEIGATNRL